MRGITRFVAATVIGLLPFSVCAEPIKFNVRPATPKASQAASQVPIGVGCKIRSDLGSGVNTDAGVLTCSHVIERLQQTGSPIMVDCEGEVVKASSVLFQDRKLDVALLRVQWQRPHPVIKVCSSKPRIGDSVASIARVKDGQIGIDHHTITGSTFDGLILVDVPFIACSSGGAIVNSEGELVGIISGNMVAAEPWQGRVIPIRELPTARASSGDRSGLVFSSVPWFNNGRHTDVAHLMQAHGYQAEQLQGLTQDQLDRLHGTAHGSPPMAGYGSPRYEIRCNGNSCRRIRVQ